MKKQRLCAVILSLIVACSTGLSAVAEDSELDTRIKNAVYKYRQENYDEALRDLKVLRAEYPDNSLIAYYEGLTYKSMENYTAAANDLRASLGMTPKLKGALLELIDVLYRLDRLDEAKKWIKVAEDEGIRPAQAAFLKGLTLLKAGEFDGAIEAFTNAKELDVELTKMADYQIGVVYVKQRMYNEAKDVFGDLVNLDPDSDVASYASRYIEAIDKKIDREKPLNLYLKFGFEYDSNVVLNPDNSAFAAQVADENDTREVWDFRGDYTFRTKDNMYNLKTGYALRYSMQNELMRYTYLQNVFTLQPSVNFDNFMVTFPANYNYTIVDGKNYVYSISAGNVNNFLVLDGHMLQTGLIYKYNEYLRPPFGDEDRTGNELTGSLGWFWFILSNKGFLNIRYDLGNDWTKGRNWENMTNRIHFGAYAPFLEKFKAIFNAEVTFKNYRYSHSFFDKKRNDQIYSMSGLLSYEFLKNAEIQFQYTFVNERSTLSLYSYTRHVFTGAVQYKF